MIAAMSQAAHGMPLRHGKDRCLPQLMKAGEQDFAGLTDSLIATEKPDFNLSNPGKGT